MSGPDREKKGAKNKPPRVGSSLTDAVVAALSKVEEEEPAAAEAGCAATTAAESTTAAEKDAEPPMVGDAAATHTNGTNGFRSGPGSFSELVRRWSGDPAAGPSTPAASPKPEPAPVAATSEAVVVGAPEPEPVATEPSPSPEPATVSPAPEPARVDTSGDEPTEAAAATDEAAATEREDEEAATGEVRVRYYGCTDVGLVREHNEDNFLVADLADPAGEARTSAPPGGGPPDSDGPDEATVAGHGAIFVVCDGMGGAAAGEVASQMAIDTIHEVMASGEPPADRDQFARRLVYAIEEAGHRIFSAAKMDRSRRGMGTTATLAGLMDNVLFVGEVGDSRAYVLRGDQFDLISKDQSLVNQLIEAGQLTEEEAEAFEHSNIILQALGTTEEVTVDLTFLEMRRGDRLLVCSDGLSGFVHGEMMKEVLQTTPDMAEAANKLLQMANAGGGHDNITLIIADFDGEGLKEAGDAKVVYQQYPLPPADDVRGASVPPRETSMKSGGPKPGADVKRDDTRAPGRAHPGGSPRSGSRTGLWLMLLVALIALAAGAYVIMSDPGGEETSDAPPPPSDRTERSETLPLAPTEPLDEGTADAVDAERATITIYTDVDEGTLFVNGQAHGPISDGMTLDLAPGAYTFAVRQGETQIVQSDPVPVNAGESLTVELAMPTGDVEAPVAPGTATQGGTTAGGGTAPAAGSDSAGSTPAGSTSGGATRPATQRTKRTGGGRSGRTGGATQGGLPANPF